MLVVVSNDVLLVLVNGLHRQIPFVGTPSLTIRVINWALGVYFRRSARLRGSFLGHEATAVDEVGRVNTPLLLVNVADLS